MSNKLYEENDIQNIANAIRNKNGTEDTYKVSQMSTAINSIEVIEQATAEGESLSLTNTKAMPYSDYVVEGKSEQEGTPSPSNPSEIHSVADDVNLFDKEKASINSGAIKTVLDTGVRITLSSSGTYKSCGIEIGGTELLGKTITLYSKITPSSNNKGAVFIYYGNSSNMAVLNAYANITSTGSLTKTLVSEFPTNCDRVYALFYGNRDGTGNNDDYVDYTNVKLCIGDIATPYSPYNQGTVTIKQRGTTESDDYIIQTEPLRSLPNGVKDTIEADGIHRRVGRIVLDGSESGWYKQDNTSYSEDYLRFTIGITDKKNASNPNSKKDNILSNNFTNKILDNNPTRKTNSITGQFSTNLINIFVAQNIINGSRVDDFKTWLSNNPTEVLYELEEETIEPLTQNQATTMLDIIKTGSYEGTTNIYTDEDVKPTIGVEYYKKA